MTQRATKIITVLSLVYFMGCVAIAFVFIDSVGAKKALYTEKRIERATLLEREASLANLEDALAATQDDRTSLETRILPDDVISFLSLVETLGREQGVTLVTSAS